MSSCFVEESVSIPGKAAAIFRKSACGQTFVQQSNIVVLKKLKYLRIKTILSDEKKSLQRNPPTLKEERKR